MTSVRREVARQIWAIFGPFRWRIALVFGFILLAQILGLVGPYIQGSLIDGMVQRKPWTYTYQMIAISGAVWMVHTWVAGFLRDWYETNFLDFEIAGAAEEQTLNRMLQLSIGQHNAQHSGIKQSVINRGQHSLTTLVNTSIYDIVPTLASILLMVSAMFWISMPAASIVLATIVVSVAATIVMNKKFAPQIIALERRWNLEAQFRGEILQHVTHVIANAQERRVIGEAEEKFQENVAVAKPLWNRFILYAYGKSIVTFIAHVSLLALGAHYVYTGQYSVGTVMIMWSWSNSAINSIARIGSLQRQIMRMWSSIHRYCEFLNARTDVPDSPSPVALPQLTGAIEFQNVSFVYDARMIVSPEEDDPLLAKPASRTKSSRPAVSDVSLKIDAGETVAIVGRSGSGKTTLANLLLRSSDPTSGRILIDGHDLRNLDLTSYRSQIGVVEQKVPLFDRSIRYNMEYDLPAHARGVSDADLQQVADIAQISHFQHKLEQGFNTEIGERGIKLSGGEQQRLGIARALLKNPAILIFDEATSSLDAATESDFREAVQRAAHGRTTIIIAHRFSTIRYAQRIIVMHEGRIVGNGTHDDLYKTCKPYKKLVDRQLAHAPKR